MAYDAGAIEARLTISTAQADADLAAIEARVKALEDRVHLIKIGADAAQASADVTKISAQIKALEARAHLVRLTADTAAASADLAKTEAQVKGLEGEHVVVISAVFDNADIGKARQAFRLLDNAISYDAMQRLRSSPQGSVLGALNALFSPHPVIGGPSPQQAAAKGLLGQMFSAQGGGTTVVPGTQAGSSNTPAVLDVIAGKQPAQAAGSGTAGQAAAVAGAGDLASAATAEKAAAADQVAAAAGLQSAAGDLRDAAIGLAGTQAVIDSLPKILGQHAAAAASPVAAAAGGGGGGGGGAAGAVAGAAASAASPGAGGQSAAAGLIALAGAADTAAQAAQYASAAQKVFTGTETDVAAAAKTAAANLSAMAAASTSSGDASRYGYAQSVAQSLAVKALGDSTAKTGQQTQDSKGRITAFSDAIAAGLPVWTAGTGAFGAWNGHLQLFGGALTGLLPKFLATASGVHLIGEAVIETAGTLIPAAIAFTAFGIAAVPTVKDLYSQMSSLYTVTQAYQVQLYPFSGAFAKVAQAVQPQVYTLFGEALYVAGKNTGAFQAIAVSAGSVVDQLGARFANAITAGDGFSTFTKNAATDLSIWGNNLGNLGGIIGGVLKVLPGYAQVIGNVFGTVTHDIETLVNSGIGQAALKAGLLAHGALIYVGLLGTGFAKLAQAGLPALGGLLANIANKLSTLGGAGESAASGIGKLGSVLVSSADLPWGWISLAAAGVAYLVYELVTAQSAAQQFAASVQQNLLSMPLASFSSALSSTISNYSAQLKIAQAQYTAAAAAFQNRPQVGMGNLQQLQALANEANGVAALDQKVQDYQAVIQVAKQDQATWNTNLAMAGAVMGTTGAALAGFAAAGITTNQIMTASKTQMSELIIEAQGYNDAIRAVTQNSQRYGAAQNALNYTAGDSVNYLGQIDSSMSKVTQAEDALINTLLGGEQAFISFQQGIGQAAADAKVAGAAVGGLNAQSLTLGSDYYNTVVPGLQKMIDALQMQNASTGQLTTVVATGAKEALAYAGNNAAAKGVLVDLINNALGPGTVSLQTLNKWVGKNATSLSGMNTIVGQVTGNASVLANVLQASLNGMLSQAAADAYGGQKALDAFAKGVLGGQDQTQSFVDGSGQHVLKMFEQMYQGDLPKAKKAFVDWAVNGLGLGQSAADQLWQEMTTKMTPALQNAINTAEQGAKTIDNTFVKSLQAIGISIPTNAVSQFANAILTSGDNSVKTSNARQALVQDLIHAGVQADVAAGMVNALQGQIDKLHGVNVPVTVTVTGTGGEYIISSTGAKGQVNVYPVKAAAEGWVVPGYAPGRDTVPAMLSPGEGVLTPKAVNMIGGASSVYALNSMAKHFAAGGVAFDPSSATTLGSYASGFFSAADASVLAQVLGSVGKQTASALAATGAAPSGNVAKDIYAALALAGAPATWEPLLAVLVSRESGGNANAVNPISVLGQHAEGEWQMLPSTFAQYASPGWSIWNPVQEGAAAIRYIRAVYGSPAGISGLTSGTYYGYGDGGWVDEPVVGRGMNSGRGYLFGESGREQVTPASGVKAQQQTLTAIAAKLDRLIEVSRQAPAVTGQHVGAAISGSAQAASLRNRFPRGGS